jgi:hypothetical protein
MSRTLLLVVGIAVLFGCKKKVESEPSGGEPADPTTYAIKVSKREKGAKWHVTTSRVKTITAVTAKETDTQTVTEKEDYVETVLDTAGEELTKVRRAYRSAQKTEANGKTRDLAYSGKTVLIEKRDDLFTFTADGRQLQPLDAERLLEDFKPKKRGDNYLATKGLPRSPVRVGGSWELSPDEEGGETITGKGRLTKAYKDDRGRQCGVIVWDLECSAPDAQIKKLSIATTYDGGIDGTFGNKRVEMRLTAKWKVEDPAHGTINASMEIVDTRTGTVVE